MEPRFGYDLSRVRVHDDAAAARSARAVVARAYTVGRDIVFGAGQFDPGTGEGRRVLAHELTHVIQQVSPPALVPTSKDDAPRVAAAGPRVVAAITSSPPALQRDPDDEPGRLWPTLSPSSAKAAQALWDDCDDEIGNLDEAQQVHVSELRGTWLASFRELRSRIEAVDSDAKLSGLRHEYRVSYANIGKLIVGFQAEWHELRGRYLDEQTLLLRVNSADSIEAAKYLDSAYLSVKIPFLVTDDDYAPLKDVLDRQEYVRVGALRGARLRAKQLRPMMTAVADLTRRGEDADKFVPGWSDRVLEEAAYLDAFAKLAREHKRDYAGELTELRQRLLDQREETLKVKPDTDSTLDKGAALVAGGVEAVLGIFVETAKEAVDLVQINIHFVSFGHYEPRFISDMAEAAAQGATTSDLLKGMITNAVETPSRFLQACRDGNWKAIGKESINLYLLADTIRSAPKAIAKIPELVKKLPELIATTRECLRVLRERTVALGLKQEARLSPEPTSHPPAQALPQLPTAQAPSTHASPAPGPAGATPLSAKPGPAPAAVSGRGKGGGPPAGMLRDTDATTRSVTVDASHPAVRNKSVANTNQPPPPAQAAAAKVAANAPRDVATGHVVDSPHGRAPVPAHDVNQPSMSTRPPSTKDPTSTGRSGGSSSDHEAPRQGAEEPPARDRARGQTGFSLARVGYGAGPLSRLAQAMRVAIGLRRGGNVAVFEFENLPPAFESLLRRLGGRNVRVEGNRVAFQNVSGSAHSEQLAHELITAGRRAGIQVTVRRIYTEYNPCTQTCLPLIRRNYSSAEVTYSFIWERWGRETPGRNAAVDALFGTVSTTSPTSAPPGGTAPGGTGTP